MFRTLMITLTTLTALTFVCAGSASAAPVTSIGGAYFSVTPAGTSVSLVSLLTPAFANDGGAGSSLALSNTTFSTLSVNFNTPGNPFNSNPGPATLTNLGNIGGTADQFLMNVSGPGGGTITFSFTDPIIASINNTTTSLSFDIPLTEVSNTITSAADLLAFSGPNDHLALSFQQVMTDGPGSVDLGSGSTAAFTLSSQQFPGAVPEPASFVPWCFVGAFGLWYGFRRVQGQSQPA